MLFPTDTRYALGCDYSNKKGIDRIRAIRRVDKDHLFTLICDSLNGISRFANLSDANFKIIKRLIPGPYTFVLPGTKDIPRLLLHPRRKTIGFRVPDYPICQSIIEVLGNPLIATTAKLPDEDTQEADFPDDLFHLFDRLVDLVIDNEQPLEDINSTIVDLTGNVPVILRSGEGITELENVLLSLNMDVSTRPTTSWICSRSYFAVKF